MSPLRVFLGLVVSVMLAIGCGAPSNYRASYSMANVQATPPSLMVATKIERPLYIVLDSARVRDVWQLHGGTGNPTNEARFTLTEFQQFVQRDVKTAMAAYFERVEVVTSTDALPSEPHVVADVKVDNVELHDLPAGGMVYTKIEITWGFALRVGEATDYAFSYAGTSTSSESYPTFEVGVAQMVEAAIADMLAKWTENDGISQLRSAAETAGS